MEQMLNHIHTSNPHTPTYGTDVDHTLAHKQDSTHNIIDRTGQIVEQSRSSEKQIECRRFDREGLRQLQC